MNTRLDLFKRLPAGSTVCEVGVFYGQFMEEIMTACPTLKYFGVDSWAGKFAKAKSEAYRRGSMFPGASLINIASPDAASVFNTGSFDLIYIDGNHTRKGFYPDLLRWMDYIKPGGVLAGHDYEDKAETPEWERIEVKSTLDEWAKHAGWKINVIQETCPSWWVQL